MQRDAVLTCYAPYAFLDDDFVPHPTPVCRPTSPPAGRPALPTASAAWLRLSTLQRETIQAIVTSFDTRGAFLLGDATASAKVASSPV